jgi:hypothetical protein
MFSGTTRWYELVKTANNNEETTTSLRQAEIRRCHASQWDAHMTVNEFNVRRTRGNAGITTKAQAIGGSTRRIMLNTIYVKTLTVRGEISLMWKGCVVERTMNS